jgi:hypothetical protein
MHVPPHCALCGPGYGCQSVSLCLLKYFCQAEFECDAPRISKFGNPRYEFSQNIESPGTDRQKGETKSDLSKKGEVSCEINCQPSMKLLFKERNCTVVISPNQEMLVVRFLNKRY